MQADNKLYRITNSLGTFYVIATSFDDAVTVLVERLNNSDYGYSTERKVNDISVIAEEHFFPEDKQQFSDSRGNLVIKKEDNH